MADIVVSKAVFSLDYSVPKPTVEEQTQDIPSPVVSATAADTGNFGYDDEDFEVKSAASWVWLILLISLHG